MDHNLKPDEDFVYTLLKGKLLPSSMITEKTGFGKSKTVAILNKLAEKGYIRVHGTGRGTKYSAE